MVLWDTSPPSSWSVGFLYKVAAPCLNTSSLDLLDCYVASSMCLDSVTTTHDNMGEAHKYNAKQKKPDPKDITPFI